jgi:hypothetical protein
MKNIFFIIFVIPLFLAGSASAQKNELGIFLGSAGYHGDIGRDYVGGDCQSSLLHWVLFIK